MSFSRTAAKALVARDLPIDRTRIGTVHAFCYRALGLHGRDALVVTDKIAVDAWNKGPGQRRGWSVALHGRGREEAEPADLVQRADDRAMGVVNAQAEYDRLRTAMVPRDRWGREIVAFATEWEKHKLAAGKPDFTDLVEQVLVGEVACPVNAAVLFADEAQDFGALELSVVRLWGSRCQHYVIAGDDQQAIYGFRGASPMAFIEPDVPAEQKTFLLRSWRLPEVVKNYASAYGATIRAGRFVPKQFEPNAPGGSVARASLQAMRQPGATVQWIAARIAEADAARGRPRQPGDPLPVLVLATCAYMLAPTIASLRAAGIAFCNPYAPHRGDWNPLRSGGAADRLARFLEPREIQTWADAAFWADWLAVMALGWKTGAKAMVEEIGADATEGKLQVDPGEWEQITGRPMPPHEPDWYLASTLKSHFRGLTLPVAMVRRDGPDSLKAMPGCGIGTVHSVKGGEAEHVLVWPDLSRAAAEEAMTPEGRDEIVRLFYVAMTRARRTLTIGQASCNDAVVLPSVMRAHESP